jgi:hypothetical protein
MKVLYFIFFDSFYRNIYNNQNKDLNIGPFKTSPTKTGCHPFLICLNGINTSTDFMYGSVINWGMNICVVLTPPTPSGHTETAV